MEENLREAASVGNVEAVKTYISNGVNVNSQNSVNGWSALHWAAKRGHVPIVKQLLEAGAKPDLENKDGKVPHQLSNNPEIVNLSGGKIATNHDVKQNMSSESTFVPNYLAHPEFPYHKPQLDKAVQPSPKTSASTVATAKTPKAVSDGGYLFQPTQVQLVGKNSFSPCGLLVHPAELVLKLRVTDSQEKLDFIEITLSRNKAISFQELKLVACSELGIKMKPGQVTIRKLPNTLLRNDKDVQRLTDYQELEVILDML